MGFDLTLQEFFLQLTCFFSSTPVVARSKAYVCCRSPAEIVGSNPTGGMDVSVVSVVCCKVEVSASSRSLLQRKPTDRDALLCVI